MTTATLPVRETESYPVFIDAAAEQPLDNPKIKPPQSAKETAASITTAKAAKTTEAIAAFFRISAVDVAHDAQKIISFSGQDSAADGD